jgi:hypothetical protein
MTINAVGAQSGAWTNAPPGAPALSDAQATQIATRTADRTPREGHGIGGPPPARTNAQVNLASLADSLGTDPDALLQKLLTGDTSDLAQGSSWGAAVGAPTSGLLVDDYSS